MIKGIVYILTSNSLISTSKASAISSWLSGVIFLIVIPKELTGPRLAKTEGISWR